MVAIMELGGEQSADQRLLTHQYKTLYPIKGEPPKTDKFVSNNSAVSGRGLDNLYLILLFLKSFSIHFAFPARSPGGILTN